MYSTTKKRGRGRQLGWMLALSISAVTLLVGCLGTSAPKTINVKGKVTYQDQPVTLGYVSFVPVEPAEGYPSRPASGTINADGTYQLSSFGENDGAVPGKYQVAIVSKTGGPTPEEPEAVEEWTIPKKYGSPGESGLTATIPADASGTLEFNFALED